MAKEYLKKVPNYLKNVTKSTFYAAGDVFKEIAPNIADTLSTNGELMRDISNDVRNYKNIVRTTKTNFDNSTFIKTSKIYKKNLFDDLKTGKFYNKEREAETTMKASGFDELFDMGDFDLDFELNDSENSDINKTITMNNLASTEATVNSIYDVGNKLGSASITNTEYLVQAQKEIHSISTVTSYKLFDEVNSKLDQISSDIRGLFDYANTNVTTYFEKSTVYYDETINLMKEMNALNKEYTEMFRNMYKIDSTKPNPNVQEDPFSDILGGGFNAKEYMKYVKNNVKKIYDDNVGGMLNVMGEDSDILLALTGSPLKSIPKNLINKSLSKEFKNSLSGLDNTFEHFFTSLLLKGSNMGKNHEDNPIFELLSNVIGLAPVSTGTISTEKYTKGPVPYDGYSRKALIEVIPTYLRKILSAITGKSEMLYNYETGKFSSKKDLEDIQKNNTDVAYYGMSVKDEISKQFANIKFANKDDSKNLNKDLDTFMRFLVDNAYFFNPHKDNYDKLKQDGMILDGQEGSFNLINGAMLNLSRDKRMKLNTDIYNTRKNKRDFINETNEKLDVSGLNNLLNKSDIDDMVGKPLIGNITVDKYNKSLYDYLRDIRTILLEGIKVYSFDINKSAVKRNRVKLSQYNDIDKRIDKYKEEAKSFREESVNDSDDDIIPKEFKGLVFNNLSDVANKTPNAIKEKLKNLSEKSKDQITDKAKSVVENTRLSSTLKEIKDFSVSMLKAPGKYASYIFTEVDKKMYDIVYGKGASDNDIDSGFLAHLLEESKKKIESAANWFNDNLLKPLTDKLIGEKGLITQIKDKYSNKFNSGMNKASEFIFGKKDDNGITTGGLISPVMNNITDIASYVNNFFTGKGFTSKVSGKEIPEKTDNVLSIVKSTFTKSKEYLGKALFGEKEFITDDEGNLKYNGRSKDGLLSRTIDTLKQSISDISIHLFGTSSFQSGAGKFYDEKIKDHLPKIVSGSTLGAIAGLVTPFGLLGGLTIGGGLGFVSSSEKAKNYLFGELGEDGRKGGVISAEIQNKFKKFAPSVAGLGLLGAGSSLLLPGGPLLWSFLGGGLGLAKESERFQKFIFGDEFKNKTGKIKDTFNKYAPSMLSSGLLGAGASIFLPGGPLLWSFLGSGIGFAKESESAKEFLFGKSDGKGGREHLSKEYKEKLKKMGIIGAGTFFGTSMLQGMGAMGSFLLPGGPIGAAIISLTAGIVSQSDKVKTYLFGEYDEIENKKTGGLFGKLKLWTQYEIFEPMKLSFQSTTEKVRHWFRKDIINPLADAIDPLKKQFTIMADTIKETIKDSFKKLQITAGAIFEKFIGRPFGEVLNKYILDPMKNFSKKLFGGIGKFIGGVLSAPIKAINHVSMGLLDKHRRDGVADYYDDWKSKKESRDNKESSKYKEKMSKLNNAKFNYEDDLIDILRRNGYDMRNPDVKLALYRYNKNKKSGKTFDGTQGTNYKGPKKSVEYINTDGFTKVHDTLKDIFDIIKNKFGHKKNNDKTKSRYHMFKGNRKRYDFRNDMSWADNDMDYKYDDSNYYDAESYQEPKSKKRKSYKYKKSKDKYDNINTSSSSGYSDIDYTSLIKNTDKIYDYTKIIKDEVYGQLDGVGYNISKISNILVDQFGEPSVLPGLFGKRRGNFKGKGIFGKFLSGIKNFFTKPIDFAKTILSQPIKQFGNFISGIGRQIGNVVTELISIPGKLLKVFGNITDIIASTMRPIGEFILGTVQTGFDILHFTIKEFAGALHGIGAGIGEVFKGLGSVVGNTVSALSSFGLGLVQITVDVVPRLVRGLLDLTGSVFKATKNVVGGIYNFAANKLSGNFNIGAKGFGITPRIYIAGGKLDNILDIEGKSIDKIISILEDIKANNNCGPTHNKYKNYKGFDDIFQNGSEPGGPKGPTGGNGGAAKDNNSWFNPRQDNKKDIHFMNNEKKKKSEEEKSNKFNILQEQMTDSSKGTFNILNKTFGKESLFKKLGTMLIFALPKLWDWFKNIKDKFLNPASWFQGLFDKLSPLDKLGDLFNKPKSDKVTDVAKETTKSTIKEVMESKMTPNITINKGNPQAPGTLMLPSPKSSNIAGDVVSQTPLLLTGEVAEGYGKSAAKKFFSKSTMKSGAKKFGKGALLTASAVAAYGGVKMLHNKVNDAQEDENNSLIEDIGYNVADTAMYGAERKMRVGAANFGAKKITDMIGKILGSTAAKKVFGPFSKFLNPVKKFLVDKLTGLAPEAMKTLGKKLATKLGINVGAGAFTAGIGTGLLIATDGILGIMETRKMFQIPPEAPVTNTMRVVAAVAKFLENNITFGFIPSSMVVDFLYKLFASKEDKLILQQKQTAMEEKYKQHVTETGEQIDFETYNNRENATVVDKAFDKAKTAIGYIPKAYKSTKNYLGNVATDVKTGAINMYNGVKDGAVNMYNGAKTFTKDAFKASPFVALNNNYVRKNFGLDENADIQMKDRAAVAGGKLLNLVSFGKIDDESSSKYIHGKLIQAEEGINKAKENVAKFGEYVDDNVKKGIKKSDDWLGNVLGMVNDKGEPVSLSDGLKSGADRLKDDAINGYKKARDAVKVFADDSLTNIQIGFKDFKDNVKKGVKTTDKELGSFFGTTDANGNPASLSDSFKSRAGEAKDKLFKLWSDTRTHADEGISNIKSNVKSFFDDTKKNIKEGMRHADALLGSFFGMEDKNGNAMTLSDGVKAGVDNLIDWGKEKVNWIKGIFNNETTSGINTSNNNINMRNRTASPMRTSSFSFGDGPSGGTSGGSSNSDLINGMAYFAQGDPRWGSIAYGSTGTMASSSCGPTSAAMVLSSLSGKTVTPLEAAQYSLRTGHRVPNAGTDWTYFADIGKHYGVDMVTNGTNQENIKNALRQRRPVILTGKGAVPFTKGGHFVVAAGINSDGTQIAINDPVSKARSKFYPASILNQIQNSFIATKGLSGNLSFDSSSITGTEGQPVSASSAPPDDSIAGMFSQYAALTSGLADSILKGEEFDPNKILEPQNAGAAIPGGSSAFSGELGSKSLAAGIQNYIHLFNSAGSKYGVESELLQAIAMQESGGNPKSGYPNQPAWGIMQIENTLADEFRRFGVQNEGKGYTLNDRIDPAKAIPFGAKRFSEDLKHYSGDYLKAIQAYNFSKYSLDMLIKRYPTDWMSKRNIMGSINGVGGSYGDPKYIEHVLRYYKGNKIKQGAGNGPDEPIKTEVKPKLPEMNKESIKRIISGSYNRLTNKVSDILTGEKLSATELIPFSKIVELLDRIASNTDSIDANTEKIAEKDININIKQNNDNSEQKDNDRNSKKNNDSDYNDGSSFSDITKNSSSSQMGKSYDLARRIALGIK